MPRPSRRARRVCSGGTVWTDRVVASSCSNSALNARVSASSASGSCVVMDVWQLLAVGRAPLAGGGRRPRNPREVGRDPIRGKRKRQTPLWRGYLAGIHGRKTAAATSVLARKAATAEGASSCSLLVRTGHATTGDRHRA